MNLILFDPTELGRPLPLADGRARHLIEVLRRNEGDAFDAGVVDGPRGKGTVVRIGGDSIEWTFSAGEAGPPLDPIELIVGLPRPQTARKILQEAAALGVRAMHFVTTEKGEPNYGASVLWTSGEWRRHIRAGVEQAFATRLPEVTHGLSLAAALDGAVDAAVVALDNYEGTVALSAAPVRVPLVLAIGAERGWSSVERDLLRSRGATLAHFGQRVLRTETACVAALGALRCRLNLA